ncbi:MULTISPECIES: hypothetical protein [unclassified Sedimentibacter]|uniref:hypothetical protein n=1 Tax=unclassified Sedimentibacter TaxID=2649220 RepID=UPI0027E0FBF1|nr:hypothetical protein [Sedimentibacter sp. MB35-C1]WMJ77297.1 hypothetical protein RBQ61_17285 [Sedimentibacter sp. MB35-C1]
MRRTVISIIILVLLSISIFIFSYEKMSEVNNEVFKFHKETIAEKEGHDINDFYISELTIDVYRGFWLEDQIVTTDNPEIINNILSIIENIGVRKSVFSNNMQTTYHPKAKETYILHFKSNYDTYYDIYIYDRKQLGIRGRNYEVYKIISGYAYEELFNIITGEIQEINIMTEPMR